MCLWCQSRGSQKPYPLFLTSVKKMERGETNPFQKLRKEEITVELENHNIWTDKETKLELSNLLIKHFMVFADPLH